VLDDEKVDKFISFISDKNISIRNMTQYLIGFLDDIDPMQTVLETMQDWIKSLELSPNNKTDNKTDNKTEKMMKIMMKIMMMKLHNLH
jgi:hypothetical protein